MDIGRKHCASMAVTISSSTGTVNGSRVGQLTDIIQDTTL